MVPRYLARRVGIPALRRALGPRVSPSTGSEPLASRSSQAGYGIDALEPKKIDLETRQAVLKRVAEQDAAIDLEAKQAVLEIKKIAEQEAAKEVAAIEESFADMRMEAEKEAKRMEKINVLWVSVCVVVRALHYLLLQFFRLVCWAWIKKAYLISMGSWLLRVQTESVMVSKT